MNFLALLDRKRILYSWRRGSRGLKLLQFDRVLPETILNEKEIEDASKTIGNAHVVPSAIAASCDSHLVVVGTWKGELVLHER